MIKRWRRYAVTFLDHVTPARLFWTEQGMRRYMVRWMKRRGLTSSIEHARMWKWDGYGWVKI